MTENSPTTVTSLDKRQLPGPSTPFDIVSDMEDEVSALEGYVELVLSVANCCHAQGEYWAYRGLARVSQDMRGAVERIKDSRELLFQQLHPNKDELDRDGWPTANGEGSK